MDEPAPTPRRTRRRIALVIILGGLLLAGSLLGYLQTRHAFRHVIVPIVSALVPGELRVRDGFVTWPGRLEMEEPVYENPDAGAVFEAERLSVALSLRSLVTGGLPVIRDLVLHQPTVMLDLAAERAAPGRPSPAQAGQPPRLIPVAVERGLVQGLALTVRTAGGTATAKNATIKMTDLRPGKTGTLQLQTAVALERSADHAAWDGSATFTLTLEQNLESTQATWSGINAVRLQERSRRTAAHHLILDQDLSGSYDRATQSLHASTTLHARTREAQAEPATVELSLASQGPPGVMTASLTLTNLSADALNAWLGETSAVRFHSALVEGQAQMKAEGEQLTFRSTLSGTHMQLGMEDRDRTTPPVNVTVRQAGSLNRGSGDLTVETLSLTVSDRARTLLAGNLDRPLAINLNRLPTGSAGMPTPAAAWTVKLDRVGIQDVRPWAALSGLDALAGVRAGELNGSATITIANQAQTAELSGSLKATNLLIEGSPQDGVVGPLALDTQVRTTLADLSLLTLNSWTTTVSAKGKAVGQLRATGSLHVSSPGKLVVAEGALSLDGFPVQALNPFLARWSPTRFRPALMSGKSTFTMNESRFAWEVDLRVKEMSLRLAKAQDVTPPLDMIMTQAGSLDWTARLLRLDALKAQVLRGSRPVLDASLDKPLALQLDGIRTGTSGSGEQAPPITLTVEIHQLAVHQIRPWVAMAGSHALDPVGSGTLDGRLQLAVRGNADTVGVAGHLDLADLQVAGARAPIGHPVTVSTHLKATIAQAARATLETWTAQITSGPKDLAHARLSGSADAGSGAVDLALSLESGDLAGSLDRLGWLTERQRVAIEGGDLKGDLRIVSAGRTRPLAIKADLRSQNLRVKTESRRMGTYAIVAQGAFEVDAARTEARLQEVGLTLHTNGARTGTMSVTGHWPIGSPDTGVASNASRVPPGELTVAVKHWDGAPLADLFGLLPGRAPGPLPITVDLTLGLDPVTGTLTARGRELVGPLRLAGRGSDVPPTTVHLEHDLYWRSTEVRGAKIILTSERPQGVADRLTLSGVIQLGERPRAQLRGKVESLDAGWYADLLAPPPAQAQTPGPNIPGDKEAARPAGGTVGVGIPPDLDVEAEIGSVTFRNLHIGKGRFVAKGADGRLRATLEPTGLAGGTVEGTATIAQVGDQPELSWTVQGKGLNLPAVEQSLLPDRDLWLTGQAAFTTSGKGRGQGEALKRSLDGTAVIDVTDGKFVKAPVLELLAKTTRIQEFKGLSFRSIHGELQLKDGWIHLTRAHVEGSTARLDATGRIGLDGRLDLRSVPKVKASLVSKTKDWCLTSILSSGDGFVTLPLAVVVKGTTEQPEFRVDQAATDLFPKTPKDLAARIAGGFKGCPGSSQSQDKQADQAAGSAK
ncbi:MAG: AsmA-like C-terminal region-containing protein [Nitrospiraceae bacterium]